MADPSATDSSRAPQASLPPVDFAFLIDSVPALVSYIDLEHRYRFNNRACAEWLGRCAEDLEGSHLRDVHGPAAYDAVRPYLERALAGERIEHETVAPHKDRGTRDVHASYVPDIDEAGRVRGCVAVVQDITNAARAAADRLALAVDAAGIGSWSVDSVTGEIDLSEQAGVILGLAPGKHPRGTIARLIPPDDLTVMRQRMSEAVSGHHDFFVECRLLRDDGARRWVSSRGRGTYGPSGDPRSITGMFVDVTAAKETERALREQSEALSTINETSKLLSAELDLQRLVQALTDAATDLTGAIAGAFFERYVDGEHSRYRLYSWSGDAREGFVQFLISRPGDLVGTLLQSRSACRFRDIGDDPRTQPIPRSTGAHDKARVVSLLVVPVVSRMGELHGGLFFAQPFADAFTDRHERIVVGLAGQAAIAIDNARLFEAAQRSRETAETANRLKDDFLATVSHELRTPLNAILGWARMLSMGTLDETHRTRAVETIERNAVVQQRIIEDILDVSRIITGKIRLEMSLMPLGPSVSAALEAVRPSAAAKGVTLSATLDQDIGAIRGDSSRVQQIVWNLLSNAIKFTPAGGTVALELRQSAAQAEISIRDTGRGIAPEFLPHVFDRFRQGDPSTTRTSGGLGLGLAIVRHLTELHGGTVEAHSDGVDRGARFTLHLPLPALQAEPDRAVGPLTSVRETGRGVTPRLSGLRVLMIDDEPDARDLVGVVLTQEGADVRTASSAREGLHILDEWLPTVIVCDIAMPVEDGYSFIQQVRLRPLTQGGAIPAAAFTAYARPEDRDRALSAGYQRHITKPADPLELASAVLELASAGA
jgi:PAS domain S-box-containing protein